MRLPAHSARVSPKRGKRSWMSALFLVLNLLAIPLAFMLLQTIYGVTHEDGGEIILIVLGLPFFAGAVGVLAVDCFLLSRYVLRGRKDSGHAQPSLKLAAVAAICGILALVVVGIYFGAYRQQPRGRALLTQQQAVNLILDCKVSSFVTAADDKSILWVTYASPASSANAQSRLQYDDTSAANYSAMAKAAAQAAPKCGYISHQR